MSYDIIFPLLLKLVKSRWRDIKDPGKEFDNGLDICQQLRSLAQLIVNKLRATYSSISVHKQKVQKYTAFIVFLGSCLLLQTPRGGVGVLSQSQEGVCREGS